MSVQTTSTPNGVGNGKKNKQDGVTFTDTVTAKSDYNTNDIENGIEITFCTDVSVSLSANGPHIAEYSLSANGPHIIYIDPFFRDGSNDYITIPTTQIEGPDKAEIGMIGNQPTYKEKLKMIVEDFKNRYIAACMKAGKRIMPFSKYINEYKKKTNDRAKADNEGKDKD